MSDFEKWFFDVHGYVVLRSVLTPEELAPLNEIVDARGGLSPSPWLPLGRHFLDWGPPFRALITQPRVLAAMRELCGPAVRLDGANAGGTDQVDLHSGGAEFWGDAYYFSRNGMLHSGLTKALFALSTAPEGAGGFCCIPGSHKAAFPTPPAVTMDDDDATVHHVVLDAGDVVVFTDALTHGARPWRADHERRALFLSYTPGMLAWSDPVLFHQRFYDQLDNDDQRSLVRLPNVERTMAPLIGYRIPEIDELRGR